MTEPKFCTINLLNKAYQIKCPEAELEQLQVAAQKLNQCTYQQKKKFKHLNDFQALLLAALHMSHELVTCQNQHTKQQQKLKHFINSLEDKR